MLAENKRLTSAGATAPAANGSSGPVDAAELQQLRAKVAEKDQVIVGLQQKLVQMQSGGWTQMDRGGREGGGAFLAATSPPLLLFEKIRARKTTVLLH